jgi:putative selenium metabolism protein SsnA
MNSKRLIGNGILVTRDPSRPLIEDGALLIEDGHIKAVGTTAEMQTLYGDTSFLDAQGMLIMPGYINAHHHAYSAFARGMLPGGNPPSNFLEVLEGTWWKLDNQLTLAATYDSGIATFAGCIQSGVTTVIDHHASYKATLGSLNALSKAAALLGIRVCLAYEISDRNGHEKMVEAMTESFAFAEQIAKRQDHMQRALVGLHASFTLSDATLAQCKAMNRAGLGYHIHVAEDRYDQAYTLKHYGGTVVERLTRHGILNEKTLAGHCIHISESDRALLKATETTVVHNPQSNMGNAVGAPDVLAMMDQGIAVCLGTDGYTNDMLESAKAAMLLQRHQHQDPNRGFAEAAKMLFENNAKLASRLFDETLGVIKPGAAADVILVDYKPFTPIDAQNIDGHLIFGVTGQHTDTTIVNGEILMRNKRLVANVEALFKHCRETSNEVWRKLNE